LADLQINGFLDSPPACENRAFTALTDELFNGYVDEVVNHAEVELPVVSLTNILLALSSKTLIPTWLRMASM